MSQEVRILRRAQKELADSPKENLQRGTTMRGAKHFTLCLVMFLGLVILPVVAGGETQAGAQDSRLVISFYSICCGINDEAQEQLETFINRYEKSRGRQLAKEVVYWGKEGEIDYCFKLSELSSGEQKRFIAKVRMLLRKSKLVNIKEHAHCQSGR